MCMYCELKNEDDEICNNLLEKVYPFGKARIVFDLDLIEDGKKYWLLMDIYSKYGDEPRILSQRTRIHYCPMCGRKLNNEIES